MDHLSIDHLIEVNYYRFDNPVLLNAVKSKFPNDQKLVAYVDWLEKRYHKVFTNWDNIYGNIQSALKQSHGELYDYVKELGIQNSVNGKQAKVRFESGWLILANGKIYGKYLTGDESITGGTESGLRKAWKQIISPKF